MTVARLTPRPRLVAPLASLCVGDISVLGVDGFCEGHRNMYWVFGSSLPLVSIWGCITCCNYCDASCDQEIELILI